MSAPADINEAEWQQQFGQLAKLMGWKYMHVRRSRGKGNGWTTATNVDGWPDLTLWSEKQQRLMFVELKSETGRLRPDQETVLRSLLAAGQEVHILRPSDLERVQVLLAAAPASAVEVPR